MSNDNSITLNNRTFYKQMLQISLPIACQSLIACSLNLVDNLMVGSLGEPQLAAVGAGIQIFFIHWMILFGFNSGTATFLAQFWGAGDIKGIKKTMGLAIVISLATGIVFFIATFFFARNIMMIYSNDSEVIAMGIKYIRIGSPCFLFLSLTQPFIVALRATQQTRLPLYISIIVFSTNTFLNYVLIFGAFGAPKLETAGAAIATLIARTIEILLVVWVVFVRKNIVGGNLREYTGISRSTTIKVIKNALPTTLNESLWGLGHSLYMAAIGHISVSAYAAAQASNTIQNLFIMVGFSIGDAALILIGQKLGENKIDTAKVMGKKMIKLSLIVGVVSGILLILFSGPLVGFFDFTATGNSYARKILFIYGAMLFLNLYNGCLVVGILRCGGDTTYAAVSELSCVWLIGVPLAFLGAMLWHLPVYIVILLIQAEELVKAILLTKRFISGKWARNVINNLPD